jgi:hypothetical protein
MAYAHGIVSLRNWFRRVFPPPPEAAQEQAERDAMLHGEYGAPDAGQAEAERTERMTTGGAILSSPAGAAATEAAKGVLSEFEPPSHP